LAVVKCHRFALAIDPAPARLRDARRDAGESAETHRYWVYEFEVAGCPYNARRYTDTADGATIFANIWNADEQALADATVTARHLIESGGVRRVFRYGTKTGVFGREVQP
jgi:hypothetical protein